MRRSCWRMAAAVAMIFWASSAAMAQVTTHNGVVAPGGAVRGLIEPAHPGPPVGTVWGWWYLGEFAWGGNIGLGSSSYPTPIYYMYTPPTAGYGPPAPNDYEAGQRMPKILAPRRGTQKAKPGDQGAPLDDDVPAQAEVDKLIAVGDRNFVQQKYAAALERYRAAARSDAKSADAEFRQGFALVAMGRYAEAVRAFRRGLKLRPDWNDSSFQLELIYAPEALNHTNDALVKALESRPRDANLLTSLAVQRYFDGQRERAAKLLKQAASLGADEEHLWQAFAPETPAAAVPARTEKTGKASF